MKKTILVFIACLFTHAIIAQYVFNFGTGKIADWSNPNNWAGGVVPPLSVDSIKILPPDNSDGWLCRLDMDGFMSGKKVVVGSHATLAILPGNTFTCSNNFEISGNAALNVEGSLLLSCPAYIGNEGTIMIAGSGAIATDLSNDCPDQRSSFINGGPLYVNGFMNLQRTDLQCNNLFWVKGSIELGLRSTLNCYSNTINDGSITGNAKVFVTNMVNNGFIELIGTGIFGARFESYGMLVNNNVIHTDEFIGLKGTVLNLKNGEIVTTTNYSTISLDTVNIINYGGLFITDANIIKLVGALSNYGQFIYQSLSQIFQFNMDIINDGVFTGSTTYFNNGSVINNNTMNLTAYTDSNRIKVPFINNGVLTSTGPLKVNESFINKGTVNIQ